MADVAEGVAAVAVVNVACGIFGIVGSVKIDVVHKDIITPEFHVVIVPHHSPDVIFITPAFAKHVVVNRGTVPFAGPAAAVAPAYIGMDAMSVIFHYVDFTAIRPFILHAGRPYCRP